MHVVWLVAVLVSCYVVFLRLCSHFFFFFNDTATTEIYTLSLHDALPICVDSGSAALLTRMSIRPKRSSVRRAISSGTPPADRKSTRLNSSHQIISYAVFCLKKKKECERAVRPYCYAFTYESAPVTLHPSP